MITRKYKIPFNERIKTESKEEAIAWLDRLKETILNEFTNDQKTSITAAAIMVIRQPDEQNQITSDSG